MKIIFVIFSRHENSAKKIMEYISNKFNYQIIKPCTTNTDERYKSKFYSIISEDNWKQNNILFEFSSREFKFGFYQNDIKKNWENGIAFFELSLIERFNLARNTSNQYSIITIALECVKDGDNLEGVYDLLNKCDMIISDKIEFAVPAIVTAENIFRSKGVLSEIDILNLIKAKTLLQFSDYDKIKSASYDLTIGEEIWKNGLRIKLDEKNYAVSIPPYSYIIVISEERAIFPKFITARFDLKVSLFLDGVILSAAPQIEPGYQGKICSLLYNASDREVSLKKGDHFATLEFSVTTSMTKGYQEQHQGKDKISEHMEAYTLKGPGSNILKRIQIVEDWKRGLIYLAISVLLILGGIFGFSIRNYYKVKEERIKVETISNKINEVYEKVKKTKDKLEEVEKLNKKLSEIDKRLSVIEKTKRTKP